MVFQAIGYVTKTDYPGLAGAEIDDPRPHPHLP